MAFTSGRYYQITVEQEKAKVAQVGFHDMKTGGFVYGVPPKLMAKMSSNEPKCDQSKQKAPCPPPTPAQAEDYIYIQQ